MNKRTIAIELLNNSIKQKDLFELRVADAYSMSLIFKNGDLLTCQKLDCRDIRIGDIVVYQIKENIVAHRCLLVGKKDTDKAFLITKGDCARQRDPYVITEKELMGKIIRITRRHKTYALNSTWGRVINHIYWLCSIAEAALVKLLSF